MANYVKELRHLAMDCEFGDTLNQMLRDRLVCGINDSRTQQRLLSEADMDLERTLKTAQAMDMADRDAQQLQSSNVTSETNVVNKAEACLRKWRSCQGSYQNCYKCVGSTKPQSAGAEKRFVTTVESKATLLEISAKAGGTSHKSNSPQIPTP